MKKILYLLIAIMTLSITLRVSADVAPPVIDNKDKVIEVKIQDDFNAEEVKEQIKGLLGVKSVEITTAKECAKCEVCSNSNNTLSDEDIKSLKTTTLLIYIALGVLIVLMIIVIALMIARRKKDSKKDA